MLPPPDELNPIGLPTIPRTVKSRERAYRPRRLIAVVIDDQGVPAALVPATGETFDDPAALVAELARTDETPWACATDDAGRLFSFLAEHGPSLPGYKATGSVREARAYGRNGTLARSATVHATFTDFGWGKHARALVLDPRGFCDRPPAELLGVREHERGDTVKLLLRLCLWAGDVLGWCRDVGVDVRPGRGGVASQFLTDIRWWPEARRKVPRRLNTSARDELPGNHYRLYSEETHPRAVELDQTSAHHQAAARATFTGADTLHGFGTTGERARSGRVFCAPTDPRYDELRAMPGLFWLRVNVARSAVERRVPIPHVGGEGLQTIAVWSAELADVEAEPGIDVLGIVGAIVSRTSCDALNRYAEWAMAQLDEHAGNARRLRWLKALLLAVYGTMAQSAKPHVSFSTEPTERSTPELVVLGAQLVSVHIARSTRAAEPRYVNVLDRGIIESETRAETVRVAREIEAGEDAERAELIALYADSVLVAPAGDGIEHAQAVRDLERRAARAGRGRWRSTSLTELTMLAVNAYKSHEVTKRPGVPRDAR